MTTSHLFAPKISGFHGISRMIQIIDLPLLTTDQSTWTSDHGGDYQESAICEGALLSVPKVPPDCPRISVDRSTNGHLLQKQDDRASGSFPEASYGFA